MSLATPGAEHNQQIDQLADAAVKVLRGYDPRSMSKDHEEVGADAPPITADAARRIAAEHLASEFLARTLGGATVEFGVGRFYGAPADPVWLVRPQSSGDRLGVGLVIAVCPRTGRIVGAGMEGE